MKKFFDPKNFRPNGGSLDKSEVRFEREYIVDLFKYEVGLAIGHRLPKNRPNNFFIFSKVAQNLSMTPISEL